MMLTIFCTRDSATNQFSNPMFLVNAGHATRSFSDEVNRKAEGNMLNDHPEDFILYELGTFDSDSGVFQTHAPVQVARAVDLKR